jgi:hypothetical protein
LALKMEACTSETLATSTTSTQHNNPRTELTINYPLWKRKISNFTYNRHTEYYRHRNICFVPTETSN